MVDILTTVTSSGRVPRRCLPLKLLADTIALTPIFKFPSPSPHTQAQDQRSKKLQVLVWRVCCKAQGDPRIPLAEVISCQLHIRVVRRQGTNFTVLPSNISSIRQEIIICSEGYPKLHQVYYIPPLHQV